MNTVSTILGTTFPLRLPFVRPRAPLRQALRLESGWRLPVRPIQPADGPAVQAFVRSLSPESRRARFFSPIRELSPAQLEQMTRTDYPRQVGLLAFDTRTRGPRIAGIAQYATADDDDAPEFAIVVHDRCQGQGVGRHLLVRLIESARSAGFRSLQGFVLTQNRPMLGLVEGLGFSVRGSGDPLFLRVQKSLVGPALAI